MHITYIIFIIHIFEIIQIRKNNIKQIKRNFDEFIKPIIANKNKKYFLNIL